MGKLVIVGLGAGDPGHLTLAAMDALQSVETPLLRTSVHPVVPYLENRGLSFESFDHLYEQAEDFSVLYETISTLILNRSREKTVVYAVPGHPLVAETTVGLLLKQAEQAGVPVEIIPGLSFLEVMYSRLCLDPTKIGAVLDGLSVGDKRSKVAIQSGGALIITQVYSPLIATDVKLALMEYRDDETLIKVIKAAGIRGQEYMETIPLYQLDRLPWIDHLTSVYIPAGTKRPPSFIALDPLVEVMEKLLGPDGCPWDQKQTHESLKPYLIEESYEVLEAIDDGGGNKLKEELGDVLLQVVFHGLIAERAGTFDLQQIVEVITEKMIRRHPHVFGTVEVQGADDVIQNWEAIKAVEKGGGQKSLLDNIPKSMPALLRAEKMQTKAAKVGFDWPDAEGPRQKVIEEWQEFLASWEAKDVCGMQEEFGDILFALVNLARFLKIVPEESLHNTCDKFKRRFEFIEKRCLQEGLKLENCSLEQLDGYWNQAKAEKI